MSISVYSLSSKTVGSGYHLKGLMQVKENLWVKILPPIFFAENESSSQEKQSYKILGNFYV